MEQTYLGDTAAPSTVVRLEDESARVDAAFLTVSVGSSLCLSQHKFLGGGRMLCLLAVTRHSPPGKSQLLFECEATMGRRESEVRQHAPQTDLPCEM